jgi:hypothetical protein
MPTDSNKARCYRKQVPLFRLREKVKLWPSRRGILHGVWVARGLSTDRLRDAVRLPGGGGPTAC